jgi:zinc protease
MRRAPLLAVSLVGVSCAAAGRGGSLAGPVGRRTGGAVSPRSVRSVQAPGAVLLGQMALGPLTVSKWRIDNGLEVILAPDPGATSVSYTTWFRVGSRHEDAAAGETGLAHLFEHLMFTQTTTAAAAGEFDRRMEAVGGNANASTSHDFTNYVDELPPDALPLAIELEADRMINLTLNARQVETERDVVVEERLSSVEDSVDGLLDERMHLQAFKTHPYRFPVIGLMKDIEAVTPAKALRFYRTFYAPNNAVVVVAGRFDETAVLDAIVLRYGSLAASSTLPREAVSPERAPASAVRAELTRPVAADRLVVGLPAPGLGEPDRASFELATELLAGGPSSRLYRTLVVDKEIASSVNGDAPATRDPGLYALWVQSTRGHGAEEAEALVEAELARLRDQPVAAAELAKARAQLETAFWRELTSSEGRAEQLGEFEICAGDYARLLGRAAEYARVDAQEVRRIARDYFAPGRRSVVIARPKPE